MRWILAFALFALGGCASVGLGRSYSAPGLYKVQEVRQAGGCFFFEAKGRGVEERLVYWISPAGLADEDLALIRRWVTHGVSVVAADGGGVGSVRACHDRFLRSAGEAPGAYAPSAYAGHGVIQDAASGPEPRLEMVAGRGAERLAGDTGVQLPNEFGGESLVIWPSSETSPSEALVQARLKAQDQGRHVWMRPVAGRALTEQDVMRVSTAWLYANLLGKPGADDWFAPVVCRLCYSDRWTVWATGELAWRNYEKWAPVGKPPPDPRDQREELERQLRQLPVEGRVP